MQLDRVSYEIYEHAAECYPQECCGIVTANLSVVKLDNTSEDPLNNFRIAPEDYLKYAGGALFVYHSHPDGEVTPSAADRECVDRMRLPLMVVSWPYGQMRLVGDPVIYRELLGRPFVYGVFDCFTTLRDFYSYEFGITFPVLPRPRIGWWEMGEDDPFTVGAEYCGLVDSPGMDYGDVIFFSMNGAKVPNHAAVYMGDERILHHRLFSLSGYSTYGKDYRAMTTRVLRHAGRS